MIASKVGVNMAVKDDAKNRDMLSSAKAGSPEAVDTIIASMRGTVEAIAMKYIASPLDKEDLVQEGMIGLLASIRAYDQSKGASFKTFSGICIENSMQTALRKFNRQKDVPKENVVPYEDYMKTLGSAVSAEDAFLARESVSMLTDVLDKKLSHFENEVLRLHIVGCSYSEIAQRLAKPAKAVDNALQRIRKKLYETSF